MKRSFKSNDCLELLSKKLNLINVKLSDDGSPAEYQLCFAHAKCQ